MWFANVFRDYVATSFIDNLFAADYANTFAARCSVRLYDVHVLEVTAFAIVYPTFVVLREDVARWGDIESFAMETAHSEHIAPHTVFSADCPRSSEMI